jgi:hypothetical protein
MYLARLPAGDDTPQIYEIEQPSPLVREERFYTPRAWAYRSAADSGVAALDFSPIRAVKRLSTHLRLEQERQSLIQRPVLSAAHFNN